MTHILSRNHVDHLRDENLCNGCIICSNTFTVEFYAKNAFSAFRRVNPELLWSASTFTPTRIIECRVPVTKSCSTANENLFRCFSGKKKLRSTFFSHLGQTMETNTSQSVSHHECIESFHSRVQKERHGPILVRPPNLPRWTMISDGPCLGAPFNTAHFSKH